MRLFSCLLISIAAFIGASPLRAGNPDTLTILHINDTHSNLASHGPRGADLAGSRGGIARAASVVGMTRATEPNVLFLHAGDLFIGDLVFNMTFGVPELQMLQALGLDAMAVGNHEFDLTPAALLGALQAAFGTTAHFPLLSANALLDSPDVAPLKSYIQSHTIKQIGGSTVGIIGLTTPETNVISLPAPVFIDTLLATILARELTEVYAGGANVVVLLSHLGIHLDRLIATSVPNIHVIVGGHDHAFIRQPEGIVNPGGDTTWIVQAGAFYEAIGRLRLTVNGPAVRLLDYQFIPLDENIPPEAGIDAQVQGIEQAIAAACNCGLNAAIATTDQIVDKIDDQLIPYYPASFVNAVRNDTTGLQELSTDLASAHEAMTPVAALMGLAFRSLTHTDLGLTVGGATAQPLARGHVTGFDLFRMIGYGYNTGNGLGFNLATFRMSGLDLLKGLEWGLSTIELNDEFFVLGHPLRYTYTATRAPFSRLDSVWIGGNPIDPGAIYSITTNEFVLAVMKDFVGPQIGLTITDPVVYTDTTELQAVLWYIGGVTGVSDDPAVDAIPTQFALEQNYPNPFNPSTTIRFSLPTPARVRLVVYDVLGRELAALVNGDQPAGEHTALWASSTASGVYLYRLEATDVATGRHFSQTRKMILQK